MLPKNYFEENFINKENIRDNNDIEDPLVDGFDPNFKFNIDNYNYSNNLEFEILVEKYLINNVYYSVNNVFIGKLINSYPNCYNVNDDNLEGCLICITSGLTENSYALAKYYALKYLIDIQLFNKDQYEAYKLILKNDLIRRICTGYGSQIEPGDIIYYAELMLNKSGIYDLLNETASFSIVMDIFIIYHEYSHYIIRTFGTKHNKKENELMLQTAILYSHLCVENPIYNEMPKEEVLADLSALLLFFDSSDLGITDIMALLLSIVQLEKMSSSDIYTNEYRIDLLYYFLSLHSNNFLKNEYDIRNRVNEMISIFTQANETDIKEEYLQQESWNMFMQIVTTTDNPEAILNILNDRLKTLKKMNNWLQIMKDENEYEDFN